MLPTHDGRGECRRQRRFSSRAFQVIQKFKAGWVVGVLAIIALVSPRGRAQTHAQAPSEVVQAFLEKRCLECHESVTKKGGLDLTELEFDLADPRTFARWVAVHDRVSAGEMPPKEEPRPGPAEVEAFTRALSASLVAEERAQGEREGRATQRRLN